MRMRDLVKLLKASTGWVDSRLPAGHHILGWAGGPVLATYRTKRAQQVGFLTGQYRLVLRSRRLLVQRRMRYYGQYQHCEQTLLRYVTVRDGCLLVTAPGKPELQLPL